jgi:hypothetical protein
MYGGLLGGIREASCCAAQTEKQRIIWAYKILFLDVLFPLGLRKVIFMDSDQIIRTDVSELWRLDLEVSCPSLLLFCMRIASCVAHAEVLLWHLDLEVRRPSLLLLCMQAAHALYTCQIPTAAPGA